MTVASDEGALQAEVVAGHRALGVHPEQRAVVREVLEQGRHLPVLDGDHDRLPDLHPSACLRSIMVLPHFSVISTTPVHSGPGGDLLSPSQLRRSLPGVLVLWDQIEHPLEPGAASANFRP